MPILGSHSDPDGDAEAKQAWAQIAQHLQEEHAANMAADEAAH